MSSLCRLAAACVIMASAVLTGCANGPAAESPTRQIPTAVAVEAAELTATDADAWLDGLMPSLLARESIAGAIVSIVRDGEVLTERGYGMADTGVSGHQVVPVDPAATLFRIGSVSKTVTATAVMQLVEAGELDLDRPISDYLDFDLPVRFERPVTLTHLLTHTAGFEDIIAGVIGDPAAAAPTLYDSVALAPPEQIYEPGTVPAYSNYSDALAGYIVQIVSGQTYAEYVNDNIFTPAGMATATLSQPIPPHSRQQMSRGYSSAVSPEVPFEMVGPAPAGAVSASATDMSAFMLAQLGHPVDGRLLLSPEVLALMHKPALGAEALGGLAAGPRMTLGFFEQDRNGHRILEHSGDLIAFHAQLQLYPDDDTGIFIALNSIGGQDDSTIVLRAQLMDGFADRYFTDIRQPTEAVASSADHGRSLSGSYILSRRSESTFAGLFFLLSGIEVSAEPSGTITISAITDAAGSLVPFAEVEPWVWQEVGGQRRVAVDQTDGVVNAIGLNPAFTLLPMPGAAAPLLPTIAISSMVLALGLLTAPLGAVLRRFYRVRAVWSRTEKALRGAIVVAQAAFLAAAGCWALIAGALIDSSPPPPEALIRAAQVLTVLAILGVVPAVWLVIRRLRPRLPRSEERRWPATAGFALIAIACVGLAYVALVGGMLSPSVSY